MHLNHKLRLAGIQIVIRLVSLGQHCSLWRCSSRLLARFMEV